MFTPVDHVIVNSLSERWSEVDEYGNYHVAVKEDEAPRLFEAAGLSDRIPAVGNERQLSPHLVAYNDDGGRILITLVSTRGTLQAAPKKRASKKRAGRRDQEKEFEFSGYKFTSGPRGTVIKRKYV